jgi:hypothetical protein
MIFCDIFAVNSFIYLSIIYCRKEYCITQIKLSTLNSKEFVTTIKAHSFPPFENKNFLKKVVQ